MYVFVQISLYNLENTQKLIQFWSDSKIYNRPCVIPNPVMNLMTELDKYGNDIVAFSSARLDSLFKKYIPKQLLLYSECWTPKAVLYDFT